MPKANSVHSTPWLNTPTMTAIDRNRGVVPPAVGAVTSLYGADNPDSIWAVADGHPIALLMRLREQAADQIDRLLLFLDATEGDIDADDDDDREQDCEDEGAQCDDEGVVA